MSSQALLSYSVGIIQTKALPLQGGLNSHLSSARGCGFRDERVDEKEDREPGRYRGPPPPMQREAQGSLHLNPFQLLRCIRSLEILSRNFQRKTKGLLLSLILLPKHSHSLCNLTLSAHETVCSDSHNRHLQSKL